jgi:hypothetical protein
MRCTRRTRESDDCLQFGFSESPKQCAQRPPLQCAPQPAGGDSVQAHQRAQWPPVALRCNGTAAASQSR